MAGREFDIRSSHIAVDEVDDEFGDLGGLLLLHPMSRAIYEMRALVLGAQHRQPFHGARVLVDAPIAFATDEHCRHINRQPGKGLRVGVAGEATNTIELSTGDRATWSTTVLAPPPEPDEPASPPGPAAVPGPPAAPTATKTETFTSAGAVEPESVTISPKAETVQVALTWPNSSSSFDATGFTLTNGTRTLAVSDKLRITKKRGAKWLDVRIKGVHAGKLKFKIVARKVKGRTRVVAKIRQSKR